MRRASLALTILSLLLLLSSFAAAVDASGVFSESGYNFQGVPRYTSPRHSFIFTNDGTEDLRLLSARVSCQCTKVFIPEKRVYKPGEKGEVVAQLDAVRFTGVRHVTITVTFQRGSKVFEVPLNISGVIIENVAIEPQNLVFLVDQDMKPSDAEKEQKLSQLNANASSRTQRVAVVYPGYNETVARVVSSNPHIEVAVGKPSRVASGYQTPLFVSVKNDAPAGYLDATVQIWSNGSTSNSPLSLNVTGVVRAPLTTSPGTLTFFTPEHGEKITKNFVISASSEFTLKSIQTPSRALECNFPRKAIRPAKVCVIPVTFDPSKIEDATENSKLRIETVDGRVLFLDVQISSGNFDSELLANKNEPRDIERTTELASKSRESKSDSGRDVSADGTKAGTSVSGLKNNGKNFVVAPPSAASSASEFNRR